ncbi:hypothetical protein HanXRQr2_Chr16g0740921 [Helianthus annuus]|uniref:Uncharacterized protein n=1 Tax=Helianthus annuus TaxID=4232 RepID=A0A9K3DRG7_HELAN|nr:hypothetical protein HanXRQr2_Chr16g0740921 [Helianthus annuus]KAJ0820654.1 hypothetical protein HanPSC8_Chr16g0710581 [Helianthus annuus]
MRIRNVWLGFYLGHQVRIRAIAATNWMSPLIVSPLLVLFLVVEKEIHRKTKPDSSK